jgi:hypothetical protein
LRAGDAAEQAIRTQNQAVGIGLNAQTADPQRVSDRIDGIVTSVSMQADADSALDALERESVGFTASAADEALEASGNFLASVGRSAKIVRTASANACAWCLEREGTYEYPGVPKDVFQRHANCTCTLEYIPSERGDKQNAKVKEQAQETNERQQVEKNLQAAEKHDKLQVEDVIGSRVNNVTITSIEGHIVDRMAERDVTLEDIKDAIDNPLKIKGIKIDSLGRPSFPVIGEKATIYVNPNTGKITTTHKTGSKTLAKLKKNRGGES